MAARCRVVVLLLAGCYPDDWDGRPYTGWDGIATDPDDTAAVGSPLVGRWISEGADLSELFADPPFSYAQVDALFGGDGNYSVTVTTTDQVEGTVSGTWSSAESTQPASIALHQTEPYEAVASGIFEVDGDVLTYEVVQTTPDYGFSPPTPASGFGSTAGPGIAAGVNVQTYRRKP